MGPAAKRHMQKDKFGSSVASKQVEVLLDGQPIRLPSERVTLNAIRSYLETLALEYQRVITSFTVDGIAARPTPNPQNGSFSRVEARTVDLDEMPIQLIRTAIQQASHVARQLHSAVTLVLINEGQVAREFWWDLAREWKEPLVTLSLLPDAICGPDNGRASLSQLRKWQFQQLARIIQEVDQACWGPDNSTLSCVLETRALPWLENLKATLDLWLAAASASARLQGRPVP